MYMKRKLIVLVMSLIVIIGIAGTGAIYILQNKSAYVTPLGGTPAVTPALTKAPEKLLTWTDPAGFTFQYPEGLNINKHDEDTVNYAHLEFTATGHSGSLIVWAKDTNAQDLASWLKSDKRMTGANILDTTFGGLPGKKILIATPTAMLVSGTIDENILFTVETTATDREFWNSVHDTVVNSFGLTPADSGQNTNSGVGGNASGSDEAADEEEVLQ